MKYSELERKSPSELQKFLLETRNEIQSVRFGISSGQEKNVRKLRKLKKQQAQIVTLLNNPAKQVAN